MSGPIVIPDATVAAGILRPLYRRAIGTQYGGFTVRTTTGVATGIEARRQIVCSALVADFARPDRLKGRSLYVATGIDAGTPAMIRDFGFHGPIGYVEIDRLLTEPLASGIEIEISRDIPSEQYLDIEGLNQCVNWALEHCDVEYRLAFTGDGTQSYSLLDEGYIDLDLRVDSIWDTFDATSTSAPYERSPFAHRVETSGGALTLITGRTYASSETFQARVIRQGHTLIKSGGVWGTSAVGLTDDTQAAAVPIPWVKAFGMVRVLQLMADRIELDETISDATRTRRLAVNARERQKWAGAAAEIMDAFPKPSDALVSSMLWTPRVAGMFETLQGGPTTLPVSTLP